MKKGTSIFFGVVFTLFILAFVVFIFSGKNLWTLIQGYGVFYNQHPLGVTFETLKSDIQSIGDQWSIFKEVSSLGNLVSAIVDSVAFVFIPIRLLGSLGIWVFQQVGYWLW